jgi:hypothetical protein
VLDSENSVSVAPATSNIPRVIYTINGILLLGNLLFFIFYVAQIPDIDGLGGIVQHLFKKWWLPCTIGIQAIINLGISLILAIVSFVSSQSERKEIIGRICLAVGICLLISIPLVIALVQ